MTPAPEPDKLNPMKTVTTNPAKRPFILWAAGLLCLCLQATANAAIPIQHWTQPGGAQVYLVESPAIAMTDSPLAMR